MSKGRTVPDASHIRSVPFKEATDSEALDTEIVLAVFIVRDKHGLVMFSSSDVSTESIRWNANVLAGERDTSRPLVMESEFRLSDPVVQRVVEFRPGAHAVQQVVTYAKSYRVPQAGGVNGGSDPNDGGSTGRPMKFRGTNRE